MPLAAWRRCRGGRPGRPGPAAMPVVRDRHARAAQRACARRRQPDRRATVQAVPKINGRLQTVNVQLGDPCGAVR